VCINNDFNVVVRVQRTTKLLGLFINVEIGMTCVINKASLGFLRPCDVVERLYLDPAMDDESMKICLADLPRLSDGKMIVVCTDVKKRSVYVY